MMQWWSMGLVATFLIACTAAILIVVVHWLIDVYHLWMLRRERKNQMRVVCLADGCTRYWYVDAKDAFDIKDVVKLVQEHQLKDHALKMPECRHNYRFVNHVNTTYLWRCSACGHHEYADVRKFWTPQRKDWVFQLAG